MANLKRNTIELVTDVKEGEIITETFLTPPFIPLSVVYQAMDLAAEMQKVKADNEKELIDKLVDFVANEVYKGKFTKQNLIDGLHAPQAVETLQAQIAFIARGQQTDETKKFLAKKN
ncbi:hypothetical protein ABEP17_15680 [Priestia flexa]|jgi:hypothetical protein|uniref:Phage protein n=2 Tax=Priestia TaxID=2800373 RepID=A0A0V8JPH0_9BACI|nr:MULTISPECIES: hypothetical protein [Bacillaceae]KSU88906.1 hypothetical protein AS180_05240 [Priestia veravalensis]KZB89940.1 hypothetical protein A2U94_18815 [Bacillus sp. VT 712]MCG7314147.1 hypothetical protein [Priestia flexa]MCM3068052.1 hypothetical protein [Priestia flexa]MDW8515818.1 hypothetical protein [Priestia flexa]